MHFGINIATLGDYADPRTVVKLASAAEASGWEGLFVWDHLAFVWGVPSGDPWIVLSAVAQSTGRLKLGPLVTPIPRRRPHVLANAVATLDQLSEGRVIFGVGLGGVESEFTAFGENAELAKRARKLDEGLAVLNQLWSGKPVTYHGEFYNVEGVALAPLPVQRPRVPIWVGGDSDAALRRAARWDGWAINGDNEKGEMVRQPEEVSDQVAAIRGYRSTFKRTDIALTGVSQAGDRALAAEYGAAGVTWWLESLHGMRGSFEDLIARVKAGPPV